MVGVVESPNRGLMDAVLPGRDQERGGARCDQGWVWFLVEIGDHAWRTIRINVWAADSVMLRGV